jgi:hypothetical protein
MSKDDQISRDDFGLSGNKMDGAIASTLSAEVIRDASRLMNTPRSYGNIKRRKTVGPRHVKEI